MEVTCFSEMLVSTYSVKTQKTTVWTGQFTFSGISGTD